VQEQAREPAHRRSLRLEARAARYSGRRWALLQKQNGAASCGLDFRGSQYPLDWD